MEEKDAKRQKELIARLLNDLALSEGVSETSIPGVHVGRQSHTHTRRQIVYEPKIVFVGQGRKRGYSGELIHTYDPDHYLVSSLMLPLECEVCDVSPEEPLLAVTIDVDRAVLGDLMLELGESSRPEINACSGFYAIALSEPLRDAVARLLQCLGSERDSRILGRQIMREILYRVMLEDPNGALWALANGRGGFAQIARSLRRIHAEYDQPLDVETLARTACMSVSVFHQHFKTITSATPLQYLKSIRLHKARMLMSLEGMTAGAAAAQVGYLSPSQFGREFKRFFGMSPVEATGRGRKQTLQSVRGVPERPGQNLGREAG